jgi:hypothetical protein
VGAGVALFDLSPFTFHLSPSSLCAPESTLLKGMGNVEDAAESVSKARRFDLRSNGLRVFCNPPSALERYFATNTREYFGRTRL